MQTIQYSPNRSSRILEIEIEPRHKASGAWDADCKVYEDVGGSRLFRGRGLAIRDVAASCEDDFVDEAATRIADDIEHGRGISL